MRARTSTNEWLNYFSQDQINGCTRNGFLLCKIVLLREWKDIYEIGQVVQVSWQPNKDSVFHSMVSEEHLCFRRIFFVVVAKHIIVLCHSLY